MRTEQEVLNDFEKLGWFVADGYVNLTFKKIEKAQGMFDEVIDHHCYIIFNKEKQTYSAKNIHSFCTHEYELTMKEHKLLNELFTIWGWL